MSSPPPPRTFDRYRALVRARGIAGLAGPLALLVGVLGGLTILPSSLALPLCAAGVVLVIAGVLLSLVPLRPAIAPRELLSPVHGRWLAVASPERRVPTHGTHAHGQTFAVDLVFEPLPGARPEFGQRPGFRSPREFPGFGRPVRAPAAGRVVTVHDGRRDHKSRLTWGAYAYGLVEGFLRGLAGSRFVLGNVVVIELEAGGYAALAHLQRGSTTVREGDVVRAGDVVGRCGNSGSSAEPHVHLQLMDRRSPGLAASVPFVFVVPKPPRRRRRPAAPKQQRELAARR